MNNRAFTVSFGIAIFSVFLVYSFVTSSIDAARRANGPTVTVVVAKRDIIELELLDESNLVYDTVPRNFLQPGASQTIDDFKGALAIVPIAQKEQLTRTKVTMGGLRPGLARQISSGKRAVTIRVNDETGVAKLLKPGDHVDVAATIDPSGSGNKLFFETRVILQDVLVLATGKYVTNSVPAILEVDPYKGKTKNKVVLSEYNTYANVTLEVNPSQTTTLIYAAKYLDVYLALRGSDDVKNEEFTKTMMKDFVTSPLPAAVPMAPKGPPANLPGKH